MTPMQRCRKVLAKVRKEKGMAGIALFTCMVYLGQASGPNDDKLPRMIEAWMIANGVPLYQTVEIWLDELEQQGIGT